ncbi:L-sorbose 1-phosphate reductase [Escherichia coli]|nr:L-sorbose 1-phosphate reductase [Escherichia coli]
MKTTALRLYGKRDLRLETFDLPEMQEDEILATVVTDSLCLSSWKEANLGENHKKVPDDVATNPIIIVPRILRRYSGTWVKSGSTNSSRVSVM